MNLFVLMLYVSVNNFSVNLKVSSSRTQTSAFNGGETRTSNPSAEPLRRQVYANTKSTDRSLLTYADYVGRRRLRTNNSKLAPWASCAFAFIVIKCIWTLTPEKLSSVVCEQHRHRPACACMPLLFAYFNFLASICS